MFFDQENDMPHRFNQEPINFMKHLHVQGIGRGQKVLVVGCGPDAMMSALAKLVGVTGHITVIDVDAKALAKLEAAVVAGSYVAPKPFNGSHPAFDFRSDAQRLQPVSIESYYLKSTTLPFADKQFSSVLLTANLRKFTANEQAHLSAELKRVTK